MGKMVNSSGYEGIREVEAQMPSVGCLRQRPYDLYQAIVLWHETRDMSKQKAI